MTTTTLPTITANIEKIYLQVLSDQQQGMALIIPEKASTVGAANWLLAIVRKAAEYVALNEPTLKGEVTPNRLRELWDSSQTFRARVGEMAFHMLEETAAQLGMTEPIFIHWAVKSGLPFSAGYENVESWLTTLKDKTSERSGYWWDLARIIGKVLPFLAQHLPEEMERTPWFDQAYIGRLRPALSYIGSVLKDPGLSLDDKKYMVGMAMGMVRVAPSRREVDSAFKNEPRRERLTTYVTQWPNGRRYLIIELPSDRDEADGFVQLVRTRLERRIKWTQ